MNEDGSGELLRQLRSARRLVFVAFESEAGYILIGKLISLTESARVIQFSRDRDALHSEQKINDRSRQIEC